MAPLAGLTGLYAPEEPRGTTGRDPREWGTPADARHAQWGSASTLPVRGGQYPQNPVLIEPPIPQDLAAGYVQDRTPTNHAAPVARGREQLDDFQAAEVSGMLHGQSLGGTRFLSRSPVPDTGPVDAGFSDSPNDGILAAVPGQLRSGSRDVSQGFGQGNTVHEFTVGHQFRRTYKSPVPQDYNTPRERPFYGKHPVRQPLQNGDNSPYGEQGDNSYGMNLGPRDPGFPTPYQQPPDPTVLPVAGYANEAPSIGADWLGG